VLYPALGVVNYRAVNKHPLISHGVNYTQARMPSLSRSRPIAGMVWNTCRDLPCDQRPSIWVVSELPLAPDSLPPEVTAQIAGGAKLIVVEEHISHGGLAQMMLYYCATHGITVKDFHSLHAPGIAIGVYGSQSYLRQQSQLTPAAIRNCLGIYE
jgi:hypothetical protein